MNIDALSAWVAAQALTPTHIDCATVVMLKILDGKCKMDEVEKRVMAMLYDQVCHRPGQRFGAAEHALIATARQGADEAMKNAIYERRVLAETVLSRPVMKAFKAMIRANGLFAHEESEPEEHLI